MIARSLQVGSEPWSVSLTQSGFWQMAQALPNEPLRNISGVWRIEGALDVQALRGTIQEIHRRHDLLRASFVGTSDGPVAIVAPSLEIDFVEIDLSSDSEVSREERALELIARERRLPFSVERGPLSRCRVYRLRADLHLLLMVVDHLVFDGWSYGVLVDEINELYPALRAGRQPSRPELPIQFSDFARWEHECLQGARMEELWGYWRERLAGNVPGIPIPTDAPRPQEYRHMERRFSLEEGLSTRVREFSRRNRATLFMTLMAGYNLFLSRLSGMEDLSVVFPVANRRFEEMRTLIGPALNLLVLRTRARRAGSFAELVQDVRRNCLKAFSFQEMPFEILLERLGQQGRYRAMLAMENFPVSALSLPGTSVQMLDGDAGASFYDFTLVFFDSMPKLNGYLAYNGALFQKPTIERHIREFAGLLSAGIENPEARLDTLRPASGSVA